MKERAFKTVVIGSGCAGLNAADWLAALDETDVALLTENMQSGTSRNTGSDKQTYYNPPCACCARPGTRTFALSGSRPSR